MIKPIYYSSQIRKFWIQKLLVCNASVRLFINEEKKTISTFDCRKLFIVIILLSSIFCPLLSSYLSATFVLYADFAIILYLLSCSSRMSMVIFSDQGEAFRNPMPKPERPKSSPTVTKSQSCEASYSRRELSHMKACRLLQNLYFVSIMIQLYD